MVHRTYDSWKAHNPYDEAPTPEVWVTCDDCAGQGEIETPRPFADDPYFCVVRKCVTCNGAGGHIADAEPSTQNGSY